MWKIDPDIDVARVSLEDVKFIFAQAEKRLDNTVKTGENIASRTISMITLMAAALIAISGFTISDWQGVSEATNKGIVALIGSLYIAGLFLYMITNVLPNNYFVLGSEPDQLMTPQYFDKAIPQDKATIFIYMGEIENYSLRIEKNLGVNRKRLRKYRLSVILLAILPLVLGTCYLLLEWLF